MNSLINHVGPQEERILIWHRRGVLTIDDTISELATLGHHTLPHLEHRWDEPRYEVRVDHPHLGGPASTTTSDIREALRIADDWQGEIRVVYRDIDGDQVSAPSATMAAAFYDGQIKHMYAELQFLGRVR